MPCRFILRRVVTLRSTVRSPHRTAELHSPNRTTSRVVKQIGMCDVTSHRALPCVADAGRRDPPWESEKLLFRSCCVAFPFFLGDIPANRDYRDAVKSALAGNMTNSEYGTEHIPQYLQHSRVPPTDVSAGGAAPERSPSVRFRVSRPCRRSPF